MNQVKKIGAHYFRVPLQGHLVDALHGTHSHFELITATVTLEDGSIGTGYTYTGGFGEFPIVKDTTPNMMNPRLYTTSYNKPQGQQFDDTAVLSFIKLQYT